MDKIVVWVTKDTMWAVGPGHHEESLYAVNVATYTVKLANDSTAAVVWFKNLTTEPTASIALKVFIKIQWQYHIEMYVDGKELAVSNPFVMDGNELPGMWETSDLIGGKYDKGKSSNYFNNPYDPYDPKCHTFARDMDYLDTYKEAGETRVQYVIENEGTYNSFNGHFLCNMCYIDAGMPTAPMGWKCP